jgi:hypothetical protein
LRPPRRDVERSLSPTRYLTNEERAYQILDDMTDRFHAWKEATMARGEENRHLREELDKKDKLHEMEKVVLRKQLEDDKKFYFSIIKWVIILNALLVGGEFGFRIYSALVK